MRSDEDSPAGIQFRRPARRASGHAIRRAPAAGCTTRQHNAHITESRVIRYPWHPWYGRSVVVVRVSEKREQPVFRCAPEMDAMRSIEVPQWMFDAAVCCRMTLAPTGSVCIQALRELARLLCALSRAEPSTVPKKPSTSPRLNREMPVQYTRELRPFDQLGL